MNKFQEIINGNIKPKDHGGLSDMKNFKVCEYAFNHASEGIRQSLLKRWIKITDYLEAGGVFNLPLGQNESHIVSEYDSQIKIATGLNNCTSLIVAGEKNSFVTHNNIPRIIKENKGKFEKLLAEYFDKIQASDYSGVDIFITGGNYFNYEWLEKIADELIQDVQEKKIEFGFSKRKIDTTIQQIRYALYIHNSEGIDNKKLYLESIDFLVEQIKKAFGDVDPVILGCNRIPTSTDVIVKKDQIIVVKPLQCLGSINIPFKASKINELTKEWDAAENKLEI